MTKDLFARGISKAVPVLGTAVSGGLTFVTYKPMAEKLRKYLASCKVADVKIYKDIEEGKLIEEVPADDVVGIDIE